MPKRKKEKGRLPMKKAVQKKVSKISNEEIEQLKQSLLQRQSKIFSTFGNLQRASSVANSGDLSTLPQHTADSSMREYEQSLNITLAESAEKELERIREALKKIDNGSYGICENCQEPINIERLKILPYAKLCIKCEREKEG